MYGAVAAVVRDDRAGVGLLLTDLHDAFDDFTELLAAIAFATLDRLDAALEAGPALSPRESRTLAEHVLVDAHRYALAEAIPVQTAARRLDAVRRHDHEMVAAEVQNARSVASDDELLWGATALLTAVACAWARRTGRPPNAAVAELCLAVSAEPAG